MSMMKQEFVDRVNAVRESRKQEPIWFEDVSNEDYQVIETVYMYHPAVRSKQDIAEIYSLHCGMLVIRDMEATARKFAELEEQENQARAALAQAQKRMEELRNLRSKMSA